MTGQSLRARLIVIILTPLFVVAVLAAVWQFRSATARAADIFDRGLLSAALAISRDVTISGGDALTPATRRLINDTSGGDLFYHVFGPDGTFVTGYSTPPRPPRPAAEDPAAPLYFDGTYQGKDVRVLRFQYAAVVDGITGALTVSVWQDRRVRLAFVADVIAGAISVIALLFGTVALIVWFGVRRGLKPLLELEEAIAQRTPTDLTPIRRSVPIEAQGIVQTLNALLNRIARRISSKDEFISNAAHQLRNPIAGVLALAEAVETAPTPEAAKSRSAELVTAAREATHLTNQLLSFERARGSDTGQHHKAEDLVTLAQATLSRFRSERLKDAPHVRLEAELPDQEVSVEGDAIMLQEAVLNLLTNALVHGGPDLSLIQLSLSIQENMACLRITDDGVGISSEDRQLVITRFAQANQGPGTGLGLPIAARVAEGHEGVLEIDAAESGASIRLLLPLLGSTVSKAAE